MTLQHLVLLFALAAAACAPETTTPRPNAPPSTPCSADECAKIPEPPISPLACGAGHEKDVRTTCGRAANGQCTKTLACDSGECNFVVGDKCFATSTDACAAAGCAPDACLLAETHPVQVSCKK